MKASQALLLLISTLTGVACDHFSDEPELLFTFSQSSHGVVITPSIDAASLAQSQIVFVGHLNTPRPCYRLTSELDVSGNQVTLTVDARQNQASNCEQIVGGFIYEGSIRKLNAGTYQVHFRHRFDNSDWPDQEFNTSVLVR